MFLIAHLAYGAAFMVRGVAWGATEATVAATAIGGLVVWRWLHPHLDDRMRGPVARDRFVSSGLVNRAWGLPLYYLAQVLLAGPTASV